VIEYKIIISVPEERMNPVLAGQNRVFERPGYADVRVIPNDPPVIGG
jgi:hypothetical protein